MSNARRETVEVGGNTSSGTEDLIASKNLLEAVFNTSTLGLHVLRSVRNDQSQIIDFDIVLTNKTSDKIAGRKVSGMRMLEGWPHTKAIGLFDKFVETAETGKPLAYEYLYEGDGVRAWFQWLATRLDDGLYVTIEDVTTRKTSEERLQHTADKLQSTFDGVPAIIALLTVTRDANHEPVDFVISAANKALSDLTGCDTQSLIGQKLTDLYPEAFRGELRDGYLRVFSTGEPLRMEFLYPGRDRWFSILVSKQVDGTGIVVAALEITEQKKAEEQKKQNQLLAELDKAKTEFFTNVSHEFRTPLTLMLGPLAELIRIFENDPAQHATVTRLKMVERNTLRLQKLVNSLLDFTRIEAGRTEAIFQPTDIGEYTALLSGNFRSAIENAGLRFLVNCESTEPVYINQDMWEKIVLNLLSNAFKFTFAGKIEVTLKSCRKHVQLQVRDSGIGISHDNLNRIFERFIRIQNARSRTFEGTGIGLALVKELVKIHGGSIKVKSSEGKGSAFIVSIPKGKSHLPAKNIHELKDKEEAGPLSAMHASEVMGWTPAIEAVHATAKEAHGHSREDQRRTILLVDDNSDIRAYVKNILGSQYLVFTANNGSTALKLISEGLRPDMILTDIMMPEVDGYSLLSQIRAHVHLSDIPVIFLSAKASEEARIDGIRRGADDFVIKPFSSMELLARIDARMRVARVVSRQS